MNFLAKMFHKTLEPTKLELLEADSAWWKDCANHWKAELDKADAECHRLYGHVEILQDICANIVENDTPGSNATVKRMVELARAGLPK